MILQRFLERLYPRFFRGDSAKFSIKTEQNGFTEGSTRSDPQTGVKNGIIQKSGDTKGFPANQKTSVKLEHQVASKNTAFTTDSPRSMPLRVRRRFPNRKNPVEKRIEFDNTEGNNIPAPLAQRRTMSRRKFEAVAASIALKARNEIEEKRRKAYEKAVGHLRIEFVDRGGNGSDDDELFGKEFEMVLNFEQRDRERKDSEWDHYWHHSFGPEKRESKKTKKDTKPNDETADSSESTPSAEIILKASIQHLHRQYVSFAKNLPISPAGSIFVRVPEHRLDLPRILITGPHGTPYANGLFFFDFWAKDYPHSPPMVQFLTTGYGSVRFNPNLYNSGKVCLSLLGTWRGPGWDSGKSNLLQVLLSCQGLVFGTAEPFYNEPGYGSYKESPRYHRDSNRYNKEIRKQTLRWAILDPLQNIVLQEERVDARKRFLEKLKKQRLDKKDVHESSFNSGPSVVPNPNPNKTKNERSSKKKGKKPKWRGISNRWSGTPKSPLSLPTTSEGLNQKDRGDTPQIPFEIPPRLTYEYSEFTAVVIGHFVETADSIEEQLQSWHELDPGGTKFYVNKIRKWQRRLLELVESRRQSQKDAEEGITGDRDEKGCTKAKDV
jgi:baculoviral IAP repeat-containing protein 6